MEGYFGVFSTTGQQSILLITTWKTLFQAFTALLWASSQRFPLHGSALQSGRRAFWLACIATLRINTLIRNHQWGPSDAYAWTRREKRERLASDRCSGPKMLCGYAVPGVFQRAEGVQCYLSAPGSLTNSALKASWMSEHPELASWKSRRK